jgi:transcription elongation factor Elf1
MRAIRCVVCDRASYVAAVDAQMGEWFPCCAVCDAVTLRDARLGVRKLENYLRLHAAFYEYLARAAS